MALIRAMPRQSLWVACVSLGGGGRGGGRVGGRMKKRGKFAWGKGRGWMCRTEGCGKLCEQ